VGDRLCRANGAAGAPAVLASVSSCHPCLAQDA